MPVNRTEPALEDLVSIKTYIAKDSIFYARRFIERIFDVVEKLTDFRNWAEKSQKLIIRKISGKLFSKITGLFISTKKIISTFWR